MEELYTALAYIAAGVSLSAGSISLFIGLQKKDTMSGGSTDIQLFKLNDLDG